MVHTNLCNQLIFNQSHFLWSTWRSTGHRCSWIHYGHLWANCLHANLHWSCDHHKTCTLQMCTYPLRESTAMSVIKSSNAINWTDSSEVFESGTITNLLESYTEKHNIANMFTYTNFQPNIAWNLLLQPSRDFVQSNPVTGQMDCLCLEEWGGQECPL